MTNIPELDLADLSPVQDAIIIAMYHGIDTVTLLSRVILLSERTITEEIQTLVSKGFVTRKPEEEKVNG